MPVVSSAQAVRDGLVAQPGGPELLALASGGDAREPALVGGAVRDLLLGRSPRELDVTVAGEAAGAAGALAELLGSDAGVIAHGRFGTAVVTWPGGRVDLAARRTESYPAPGALPEVRAGSVEQDLARRDFTVNAIALPLADGAELQAVAHALEDLAAGRLRVLHELSFCEDPTRLLRLARYAARLGFAIEPATAELAAQALVAGALDTVSDARVGTELRLALAESDALGCLSRMDELGLLTALGLSLDPILAHAALALLPGDGRPAELLAGVLLLDQEDAAARLGRFECTAAERDRIAASARGARGLARRLADAGRPSELQRVLRHAAPETVALAGALGAEAKACEWLSRLRHVQLAITGEDLLAAGVSAGPDLGRRLAATLARKLDGELGEGREAELAAAIGERP